MPKVQQSPLKCQDLLGIIAQPNLQTQSVDSALMTSGNSTGWSLQINSVPYNI